MGTLPCRQHTFPYHLNQATFNPPYLQWLRHLGERLGLAATLRIWERSFAGYDDAYLQAIRSANWQVTTAEDTPPAADQIDDLVHELLLATNLALSPEAVKDLLLMTPPTKPSIRTSACSAPRS